MGILGWIYYLIVGVVIFFLISLVQNKFSINKLEKIIITIIIWIIIAGISTNIGIPYLEDFFLVFVFALIIDSIYSGYFLDRDFFDRNEKNLEYYIILIVVGFIINQSLINKVSEVFLTGEELRSVFWFLAIIFLYKFSSDREIFKKINNNKKVSMSSENILVQYARLKYRYNDYCNYDNKDITNIIYSIMIYQNNKRSKLLRSIDYFIFRINGKKRRLGIMQVESNKFITDTDSIDIVYKKLDKLYKKNKPSRGKVKIEDIFMGYDKNNSDDYMLIYNTISKF